MKKITVERDIDILDVYHKALEKLYDTLERPNLDSAAITALSLTIEKLYAPANNNMRRL